MNAEQNPAVDSNASPATASGSAQFNAGSSCGPKQLRVRLRRDLVVVSHESETSTTWIVKDPIRLEYFQFSHDEWSVIELLEQAATVQELESRIRKAFPGHRVHTQDVVQLLARLENDELLEVRSPSRGKTVYQRANKTSLQRILLKPLGFLSIRFPGIYPKRVLDALEPFGRIFFSKMFGALAMMLMIAALLLMISQAGRVYDKVPTLESILAFSNLPWLILTLTFVKILHELGHGLACRRFGAECHEMGIMILVFAPLLYCDVSDAWLLKNKWHRIVISAAGIYVELFLAAICAILWFFTNEGLFNAVCFNVVLISSINTLLVNGNPLMKYDGYYVLVDLLETPNLQTESKAAFYSPLKRFLTKDPLVESPAIWLRCFGLAMLLYRFFILFSISWLVYEFFKGIDQIAIGRFFALMVWLGMIIPAMLGTKQLAKAYLMTGRLYWTRFVIFCSVLVFGVGYLLSIPFESTVGAPAIIQSDNIQQVFAPADSQVLKCLEEGSKVSQGDEIASLRSLELERRRIEIKNQIGVQKKNISNFEVRAFDDASVFTLIEAAKESLIDLEKQLDLIQKDIDALTIHSQIDGLIVQIEPVSVEVAEIQLTNWLDRPTSQINSNCWLARGQQLCSVVDPTSFSLEAFIQQSDLERFDEDATVRIFLDQYPETPLDGQVVRISSNTDSDPPRNLVNLREVEMTSTRRGTSEAIKSVRVRIQVDNLPKFVTFNSTARVKIKAHPRSTADWIWNWVAQTVRFGR